MNYSRDHIKYYFYGRKSSETEERQVQSIMTQLDWAHEMERTMGITIVGYFTESCSAKEPYKRKEFKKLMRGIEQGKANGILSWHINRLTRNPVDSGELQWKLSKNLVLSVLTHDREYLPSDSTLILSIDTGMSSQYVIDLSIAVKRGLSSKRKIGWFTSQAPRGYMNDKTQDVGRRTIIRDPNTWPYIRRLFDLVLTGNYNPQEARAIINAEGFRSRTTNNGGGKPLCYSGAYKILTNIFYAGMFEIQGKLYQGAHDPMVTMNEFTRVQQLLGERGKPRPQTKEFAYTGLIRCGECGAMITAETKLKYVVSTKETKAYTYYRCTKRLASTTCKQLTIRVELLEKQLMESIDGFTISPEFKDFTLDILRREASEALAFNQEKYKRLGKVLKGYEQEYYDLNKTYTRGVLDDDFYLKEKQDLQNKIAITKNELAHTKIAPDNTAAEDVFTFAAHAQKAFEKGPVKLRGEICRALGKNFVLKDGRLTFEQEPWLRRISEVYPKISKKLEPLVRTGRIKNLHRKSEEILELISTWLGIRDDFRTLL